MTQRKLLIGASALTIALVAFVVVASGGSIGADTNTSGILIKAVADDTAGTAIAGAQFTVTSTKPKVNKKGTTGSDGTVRIGKLKNGTYTITEIKAANGYDLPSPISQNITLKAKSKPTTTTVSFIHTATGGNTTASPSPNTTPTPVPSPVPSGKPFSYVAMPHDSQAYIIAYTISPQPSPSNNTINLSGLRVLKKTEGNIFKSLLKAADPDNIRRVRYDALAVARKIVPDANIHSGLIVGKKNNTAPLDQSVGYSYCLTSDTTGSTDWQQFAFRYKAANDNLLAVAYRVSDDCPSNIEATDGWVTTDLTLDGKSHDFTTAVGKTGKYFQYRVNIKNTQSSVNTLSLIGQPLTAGVTASPSPNASATPSTKPSTSASPNDGATGFLLIHTQKIVLGDTTPSPSPSSNVLLPSNSPTPLTSATPTSKTDPKKLCFGDQEVEDVADVSLKVEQVATKGVKIEDQQTDADGLWQGIDGNQDDFPVGTYKVTFGDFDKTNFKLVAFCDPDNSAHILKASSDPLKSLAQVQVKSGQTTKLIALYAPRNTGYVTMNKFAIAANTPSGQAAKVIRIVYPGQKFVYLLKIANTGDEVAKGVVVRDVIPDVLEVDQSIAEAADANFTLTPDSRGGTLVSRTIGDLQPGQQVAIQIPVTLKADAFTDTGLTVGNSGGSILIP